MERKIEIIGHGLAGCVLALTLYRQGIPFTIKGYSQPGEASTVSSGLINPVTGRRYVKAWMIDELIEKAVDFYGWTEQLFGTEIFYPVDIARFLSNQDANDAWNKRMEDPAYESYISNKRIAYLDNLSKPYVIVTGGYRLDTPAWLGAARNFLAQEGLLQYSFEPMSDTIVQNVSTILATGAAGHSFSKGIIPNKGQAIIAKIPGLKIPCIFKEKIYFIPLKEMNMFWIGSNYQPWPDNADPTNDGKQELLDAISEVYSGEVEIIEHLAGIRPTVDDRRPLVGQYPGKPHTYLFNGMGTKGTSLTPYWSEKLIAHILDSEPLPRVVDPSRYSVIPG